MVAAASCNVLLLVILIWAFFVAVTANFSINSRLVDGDILCYDQCQFFTDNQTIVLINTTNPGQSEIGVAYYKDPVRMKDPKTGQAASFNTSFTFWEDPENYTIGGDPSYIMRGDGFTFVMSNSNSWTGAAAGRFGVFQEDSVSSVWAIEYDSWKNVDTDPDPIQQAEHVAVDIASALSYHAPNACFAYVFNQTGITLWQREVLYSWIEYDAPNNNLQVRLASSSSRPVDPLVECNYNLFEAVDEKMWIGFSGSFGNDWSVFYIYNWTFTSYGISSEFPSPAKAKVGLYVGISTGVLLVIFAAAVCFLFVHLRKRHAQKEALYSDGMLEMASMPEFISYKQLSAATKQFSDQSKLGEGGFGSVYRGVVPKTGVLVAVKKVSNHSRQGEPEFLAEVRIISQLRHRNIVQLLGFCKERGKLLLVYELLLKGSLDQALFKPKSPEAVLSWRQRWKIVSGSAAALQYLHEGWRQQVIHRDVKSSNIMLDDEYNPKLGDFGLARLVDHDKNAPTTLVAGTYGYIAPEAARTGKFTDKTDVFAFGAVCLELACGRRAYDGNMSDQEQVLLVDVVRRRWNEDDLLSVADPLLCDLFDVGQMDKVLKLGLICSHPEPSSRPTMRQVLQVLAGDADVLEAPEAKGKMTMRELPDFSINVL